MSEGVLLAVQSTPRLSVEIIFYIIPISDNPRSYLPSEKSARPCFPCPILCSKPVVSNPWFQAYVFFGWRGRALQGTDLCKSFLGRGLSPRFLQGSALCKTAPPAEVCPRDSFRGSKPWVGGVTGVSPAEGVAEVTPAGFHSPEGGSHVGSSVIAHFASTAGGTGARGRLPPHFLLSSPYGYRIFGG
jgi:hypothetical protein